MKITNIKRHTLNIPSASGIEIINDKIFIIGDNSPWIYQLDSSFKITDRIEVFPFKKLEQGIIPKKSKPDFEATTAIDWNNKPALLMLGSGSLSPIRDIALVVSTETKEVKTFSLTTFYKMLKQSAHLKDGDLNIEAAASKNNDLFLFNRGKNLILKYNLDKFKTYLTKGKTPPTPQVYTFVLQKINNIRAGFSGACISEDQNEIIFTASVENTSDWVSDGEVLGSFIGKIKIDELEKNNSPECISINEKGISLKIKVESITAFQNGFLMVTDSDGGKSELIEVIIT